MLAGEFPARASAFKRDVRQVDDGFVGGLATALAVSTKRFGVFGKQYPLGAGSQLLAGFGRSIVRGKL